MCHLHALSSTIRLGVSVKWSTWAHSQSPLPCRSVHSQDFLQLGNYQLINHNLCDDREHTRRNHAPRLHQIDYLTLEIPTPTCFMNSPLNHRQRYRSALAAKTAPNLFDRWNPPATTPLSLISVSSKTMWLRPLECHCSIPFVVVFVSIKMMMIIKIQKWTLSEC